MNSKRSKNRAYQKSFYLSIIYHIKNTGRLPVSSLSKQAYNYHIKKLIVDEIIEKIGYGVYRVNEAKLREFESQKEVKIQPRGTHEIRGHGFAWKLAISGIRNWKQRKVFLEKNNIEYKLPSKKANYNAQCILVENHKIWLYDDVIIIYNPKDKSFYSDSARESFNLALKSILRIIEKLEKLLNVTLSNANKKYTMSVSKQHYARIKDSIAKYYNEKGERIVCKYKGKEWLLIDKSLNFNEMETVDRVTAPTDMDHAIIPFLNDLKNHIENTGECLTMGGLLQICSKQQESISDLQRQVLEISLKIPKINEKIDYIG